MNNLGVSKDAIGLLNTIRAIHEAQRGVGIRENDALMMCSLPIEQFQQALEELALAFLVEVDPEGKTGSRWIDLTHKGELVRIVTT